VMFGSGVKKFGTIMKIAEWFVAGLGSTIRSSAMLRIAAGAVQIVRSAPLGFECPGINPWSLLPF
ncbi:MAG: hypothetical protein AAFP82_07245, partial [Bacteroidota bacterium]